jgi:4'-phosphopantetheinyl transferase
LAQLAGGEVHVWIARLDRGDWTDAVADLLQTGERDRASHFQSRRKGVLWARSRALLRMLLGGYLGTDPASLRFELGRHGKPRLTPAGGGPHFSLSHSGTIAVYAFAVDRQLGVDVEALGRGRPVLPLARRAFGEDACERLARLEEDRREREFLRLWTRHEARLKCLGTGLAGRYGDCWARQLEVGGHAVAALAAERAPASVACRHWTAERADRRSVAPAWSGGDNP